MDHTAIYRARQAGARGDVGAAYRVLLQLAAQGCSRRPLLGCLRRSCYAEAGEQAAKKCSCQKYQEERENDFKYEKTNHETGAKALNLRPYLQLTYFLPFFGAVGFL